MAGKDRQRRLARERYERRMRRRAERRRRTRRRNAVLAAGLSVVVVLGGVSYLGVEFVKRRAEANAEQDRPANQAACDYVRQGGGSGGADSFVGLPPADPPKQAPSRATITTNRGDIVIDLRDGQAPCTTNSFRFLASKAFYDDTPCHRLTTEGIYVLQCGDPSGTGRGGPGYRFPDENLANATYPRGTVAMANSGPDTNGSQFFIVYREGGLEPKYTPFGTVVEGLDIVESIAERGATDDQAPRQEVVIEDVTLDDATGTTDDT